MRPALVELARPAQNWLALNIASLVPPPIGGKKGDAVGGRSAHYPESQDIVAVGNRHGVAGGGGGGGGEHSPLGVLVGDFHGGAVIQCLSRQGYIVAGERYIPAGSIVGVDIQSGGGLHRSAGGLGWGNYPC